MPDGHCFTYYTKWYGDAPHLARTARRNLTYATRNLLFVSHANGSQQSAQMEELVELQKAMPQRDGRFLTEIVQINEWRDQKGDAAYALLRASTIELLRKHRPLTSNATRLYLIAFNYLLEPFVNPEMTNPVAVTCSVYIGEGILVLWETYVLDCLKLDKDLFLPSYQAMRTAHAMAHAAVTHSEDVFLNYRHRLDERWSQAALRGANTFSLEGLHSEARTGSVSKSTDQNWTPRKWVELCTKLQQIRDKRLAVADHGWKVRAARNVQRSDKISSLVDVIGWSRLPTSSFFSLACGRDGYHPPDSWTDFVNDVTWGKRSGQNIARELVEAEVPEMANQLKAKGRWPRWWTEGEDGADGAGWCKPESLRSASVKLATGDATLRPIRPVGADGLKLSAVAEKKLKKADAKAEAERKKHVAVHSYTSNAQDESAAFVRGHAPVADARLSIEAMATKSRTDREQLIEMLNKSGPGSIAHKDLAPLLTGMKLLGPQGEFLNTACQLNIHQAKDKVHAGRDRRFWVYKTAEEWLAADAASVHDCCIGSLVLIKSGMMNIGLARVVRLGTLKNTLQKGERAVQKSMTLEPGVPNKQYFKLEICAAEEVEDEEGNVVISFRSSGYQLADCDGARTVRMVARSSLHPIDGTVYATMSRDEAIELRSLPGESNMRTWLTQAEISGYQPLEAELCVPDSSLCFMCHQGWADESTGTLLPCKGTCARAFHLGCYPNFEGQVCGKCSGKDCDICCICKSDVSEPCKSSDYFTGEMVQCEGGCLRWWHQRCHSPPILDSVALVADATFVCAACGATDTPPSLPIPLPTTSPRAPPLVEGMAADPPPTAPATAGSATGPVGSSPAAIPRSMPEGAIQLDMTYGEGGKLGFSVTARNIVDGVHSGGAAEKGGLKEGDLLIAVNGAQLIRGLRLVSVLPKGGQGTAVTLFVVRPMVPTPQQPEQSEPQEQQLGQRGERRKRARPDRLGGSTSLEGVRLGDGPRSHIQRLAGIFAGQTGDSL